jgi:hypothetical protein
MKLVKRIKKWVSLVQSGLKRLTPVYQPVAIPIARTPRYNRRIY